MTNMKKILFGLGTVTTVVAPVAAVVACGSDDKKEDTKKDGGSTTPAVDTPAVDTTAATPAVDTPAVDTTADQWSVKNATELKNVLTNEVNLNVVTLTDDAAEKIFTQIGGVADTELLLDVFYSKTAGDVAIVVEGNLLPVPGGASQVATTLTTLKATYGIEASDLVKGGYVILVKAPKVEVRDVVVDQNDSATVLGLLA